MRNILVSINCSTYNHEKYIKQALDSFLMQKIDFDYEILIHDDASTDNTQRIIEQYRKKYPEIIKPIFQKENQKSKGKTNIHYTFNHTRAKGKYVAICEGDDFWIDSNKLQKQVNFMEENEDFVCCVHAVKKYDDLKRKYSGEIRPYKKNVISTPEEIIIGEGGFFGTNSIFYRKHALDNPPDWYFQFPVGDYPLQMYLSFQGKVFYLDEYLSAYRINVKNSYTYKHHITVNHKQKKINANLKMIKSLNTMKKNIPEKYQKAVDKRILKIEFTNHILNSDKKELKDDKFKNFWKKMPIIPKIKTKLKVHFPKIYDSYYKIKHKL